MDASISLSNTNEKLTRYENTELSSAYLDDKNLREIDAISTERIDNGITLLNTYTVTSDAISGGMGSVWRVHHQSWNTDLAMKRPQPRFFAEGSEKRKEQFVRECENWINLGLHPNIVSCYYVREIGGAPTIFSEWMDNGSLADRIKDGSLYEGAEDAVQKRILDIAIQSARGLQYSHENGLIHQDFKPGNLLLTKSWDAKVADFGLAKARTNLEEKSEAAKTTGYTLAYCPAEQANREKPARWMDVYAWALTVLEMYVGRRLWQMGAEVPEHFDEYVSQCAHPMPKRISELLSICLSMRSDKKDVFDKIEKALLINYKNKTGETYPVEKPDAAGDTADSLNNRALSFLDLGKKEEALALWDKALRVKPNHFYTTYNLLTSKWYDAQVDDLTVLVRLREIDRFMNLADSKEGLRHVADCRGTDEAVKEIPFEEGQADWQASDGDKFECFDEQNHTKLVGVSPQKREHGASFGSLKLYDTITGRCIRTVCPRLSDDAAISFGARDDNFGELRMTADGCYCYPDASHTTLYYRRPDMKSRPPVWILSRILPYSELAQKKRRLKDLVDEAEKRLRENRIVDAYACVEEAYTLVESTEDEWLNKLNERLAYYGTIKGIRNYSPIRKEAWMSKELRSSFDRKNGFSAAYTVEKGRARYNGAYLPQAGCCYGERLSKDRNRLYFLQSIPGEAVEKNLYVQHLGDFEKTTRLIMRVRGRQLCISPDERALAVVEYIDEPDAPIRRLLHVYSVNAQREVKTILIPNNVNDLGEEKTTLEQAMIRDMCFRHDSKAVFLLKATGAVTMIDLMTDEELYLFGDRLTVDKAVGGMIGTKLLQIEADKDMICLKAPYRHYYGWKITYELEFAGWSEWDAEADELLERFAADHPVFTEERYYDFLRILRDNGFGGIDPEIVHDKLEKRCRTREKRQDVKSYGKPFLICLGVAAAIFLLLAMIQLWYARDLHREDIWLNGVSTRALVTDITDNGSSLTYELEYEADGEVCTASYTYFRSRLNNNPDSELNHCKSGTGTVELHYFADDPQQCMIELEYTPVAKYRGLIIAISVFLALAGVGVFIYAFFAARKGRKKWKEDKDYERDCSSEHVRKHGNNWI